MSQSISERFQSYWQVDEATGCWVWQGGKHNRGYGLFTVDGKRIKAHRWSWEHHVGPIPDGLVIDHLCRNTSCVNPDHLEPVTQAVNMARSHLPNFIVRRTGLCSQGHELTDANTYTRPSRPETRECRTCRAAGVRALQARRAAVRNVPPRRYLTPAEREEIRKATAEGASKLELAARFGVSRTAISRTLRNGAVPLPASSDREAA